MVGQSLAHYQITQKIGAGGMGEVYRATDSRLHREVAIKVISAEFSRDSERMARFEREAQVLAAMTHPSIAAVYGLEDSGGSKALVMELVEGEDLSDRLRRGALPVREVVSLGAQIAEALEAAHEHGIIHRDLKPANVKLTPDGRIKLLDFGLAKALEGSPASSIASQTATLSVAATRAGIILGTAAYMSPEQATASAVDRRTDVWSFGVVLFEMLSGQRLFQGETTTHTLADVIRAEIDFTRLPSETPAELRQLLERCLERDRRQRLRDIGEARIVLERLSERGANGSGLRSGTAGLPLPAPPSWRWLAPRMAAGVMLGALLSAAGAWAWRDVPRATPQLRLDAHLAAEPVITDLGAGFALSPDGSRIALITGVTTNRRLSVRRLDQLDSSTLVSTTSAEEGPYHPFFSPDGNWIAYVTPTELQKIPAAGGTPLTICAVNRSRGASWAPDGTIVLAPSVNGGLSRVPAAGGEPQVLTTLDAAKQEATHRWPQVLPGGNAVLFTSHTQTTGGFDEASIEVVEIATGERKVVHVGGSYGRYVPTGHLVYVNRATLFAVPFDLGRLEVAGTPAPIVQNVTASEPEGGAQFAFSGNGVLAYLRGGTMVPEYPVVLVDRQGRVSPLLAEPGAYASPRFSPDGSRLSLTVLRDDNWDIWVYDLERHVMTRLTFDEAADTEQVWSPDGSELIFGSNRGHRPTALYRKPSDGSGEEQLLAETDVDLWPTTWSPDGRYVGFSAARESFDVGLLPLAGEPKYQWIVATPFVEIDPAFSPDGRWIAYASTESGQQQIYVRPFGAGGGRWQISDAGGGYPRWSRDGRELFYRSNTGVMAVSIEATEGTLRTGKPVELFTGDFRGGAGGIGIASNVFADYDVTPDGKGFALFAEAGSTPGERAGHVTFVSNWFDDLTRVRTP